MNEEILEAPLPDGEHEISDIKVGSEDEKDPEYELDNDDADDVDDDEGEDEEEGEEQVAEDDDIGESVNMDESTMVRLIINEEGIKMRRYHCPTCDKSYARTDKLRNHMKQEHNQRLEKKPPNPNPNQPKTSLHTCNWCGLTFPELTELDTHLLVHDRQKPFICLKCDKSFLNRGALIAHSVTHQKKAARADKDRKFQCRYCKRGYCRLEQLRRHVEAVHPDLDIIVALDGLENERFECPICDASYTRIEKLDLHMMTHDDTPFHCDRCDMAFKSRRELRNHDVCKADVVMVACEICPQTFTSERLRDLHTEHVHDSRVFSCPDCDREFDTRNRLVSHKRTVHEKMFECPICHKTLSRQDKLDYHMRQHNGFPCTECSTTFQTRKEWREHLVSVHNSTEGEDNGPGSAATGAAAAGETVKTPRPKPFRCDLCCASYTTQQKLDVHVRDGHSAEGYSCEHCELKFESKAKLKAHTYKHNQKVGGDLFQIVQDKNLRHLSSPSFQLCGICGLWITSSYASHVRRHQGIKPHKCLVEGCGKEFLRNCDLTSHTKTHTGEKPFPCDICGMRFSRPYKVTVHKRTHTGVRPYKCDFENCQRDFAQSFDLTLHMRRHTGEKPYSCDRCGEGFILTSILKKHQQNCAAIMIVIAEEEQEVIKMETH